jgi:D-aspartate ligase
VLTNPDADLREIELVDAIQKEFRTLRTVVFGRAPLESVPTSADSTQMVRLEEFDREVAESFLHNLGVDDPAVARNLELRASAWGILEAYAERGWLMTAIPAIVLHCSKAGLAVIRALGARGIPIVGVGFGQGQMGLSSRFVRTALHAPHPAEDEPAFIEFLQKLAPTWGGAVLFPSDDSSLVAVARNKDRLAKYFHVAAADWPVVQSLIEKARTYEIAARAGIPCPRLRIVDSLSCGVEFAKEIGFPCLIKPSVSHTFFRKFYQKMIFAHSRAELERGIETTLGYGGELMLCEFIPGNDSCGANYNSFCTNGNPLAEFTAQKLRLKPTLIGFPTAVQSKRLPDVTRVGRQMMKALMFSGFSCTEFKHDARDGIYKLMEVNARHNY